MVSVAFLFSVLSVPVRAIGFVLGELPRAAVGWRRVNNVLTATGEMPLRHRDGGRLAVAVGLRFDDVSFAYEGAAEVLHDVTLRGAGGRDRGAGRPDRFRQVDHRRAGRAPDGPGRRRGCRLGGADVRDLSAEALAGTVALVPQLPFIFDDTIAGNVSLERDAVDEVRVKEALGVAQADVFVSRLVRRARTPGSASAAPRSPAVSGSG